ncbi:MAG: phosphatidate cytidylyltransferase [Acidimicrobiales bacterium]
MDDRDREGSEHDGEPDAAPVDDRDGSTAPNEWQDDDAWLADEWSNESPSGSPTGAWSAPDPPPSKRAVIAGVEAGVAAGLRPSTEGQRAVSGPRDHLDPGEPTAGAAELRPEQRRGVATDPQASVVQLPSWTDPPTREVPRVLLDPTSEGSSQIPGPVWREVEADFDQDAAAIAELVSEGTSVPEHGTETRDDDLDSAVARSGAVSPAPGAPLPGARLPGAPLTSPGPAITAFGAATDRFEESTSDVADSSTGALEPGRGSRHDRRGAHVRHRQGPISFVTGLVPRSIPGGRGELAGPERREEPSGDESVLGASSLTPRAHRELEEPSRDVEDAGFAPRRRRSPVVATVTGLVVGAIVAVCFLAGPPAVLALICVVLVGAVAECYHGLRRAHYRPATLLGLLATPGLAVAAYFKGTEALPPIAALFVLLVFCWYLAGFTRQRPVPNMAATLLGWLWIGVLGSFAALLLQPSAFGHRHGLAYLLGAVEATVGYDVGGYFFGSWLGRHKLASVISPNKTWEGLVGGCLTAFMVAIGVTSHMAPWDLPKAALLGVVVAVAAPLGDLAESLVKRDLGLKDMGSLLPAHGGLLDRIDALLFVLPATYYLVRLLHG